MRRNVWIAIVLLVIVIAGISTTIAVNRPHIKGKVIDPTGKPLAGVEVFTFDQNTNFYLDNNEFLMRNEGAPALSNRDGVFRSPSVGEPFLLFLRSEQGSALVRSGAWDRDQPIKLQPWSAISGTARIGSQIAANVRMSAVKWNTDNSLKPYSNVQFETKTSADGSFKFGQVPPGKYAVHRMVGESESEQESAGFEIIDVPAGATAPIAYGGKGRPVAGRMVLPPLPENLASARLRVAQLELPAALPAMPTLPNKKRSEMSPEDIQVLLKSPAGVAYMKAWNEAFAKEKSYHALIQADGSYRFDDIPPGEYTLSCWLESHYPSRATEMVGSAKSAVTIEPGGLDEIVTVPPIDVILKSELAAGSTPPDFDLTTIDGKPIRLSALKGKIVLIDFWATWCGPCVKELPNLKKLHERFADNPNFVFIGLSLDGSAELLRRMVEAEDLKWPQVQLGEWNGTPMPDRWGVQGIPATFLIGADGKLIARGLRGVETEKAVEGALNSVGQ